MKQAQQQFCQRILPIVTADANGKTIEYKNGQTWVEKDGSSFHLERQTQSVLFCVNALEGVPTEASEGGWTAQGISEYAKSLDRNQNDMVERLLRILVMAQAAGDESEKDSNNPYKAFLYETRQLVRRCGTEDQVRSLSDYQ